MIEEESKQHGSQLLNELDELMHDGTKAEANDKQGDVTAEHQPEAKDQIEAKTVNSKNNAIAPIEPVLHKMRTAADADTALGDLVANSQYDLAHERQILAAHAANSMDSNTITSAKDLMQKVMYQVPLSRLYSILASCQYDSGSEFCPVLVKINDETIKQNNGGCAFLLQVWTIRGDMIFEKPLEKPVSNWNISDNILLFLEEINSTDVWMVKLFMDRPALLYKFVIPNLGSDKAINSVYDVKTQNYIIPDDATGAVQPDQKLAKHDIDDAESLPNAAFDDSARAADILNDEKGGLIQEGETPSDPPMARARTVRFDVDRMRSLGEANVDFDEGFD